MHRGNKNAETQKWNYIMKTISNILALGVGCDISNFKRCILPICTITRKWNPQKNQFWGVSLKISTVMNTMLATCGYEPKFDKKICIFKNTGAIKYSIGLILCYKNTPREKICLIAGVTKLYSQRAT